MRAETLREDGIGLLTARALTDQLSIGAGVLDTAGQSWPLVTIGQSVARAVEPGLVATTVLQYCTTLHHTIQ